MSRQIRYRWTVTSARRVHRMFNSGRDKSSASSIPSVRNVRASQSGSEKSSMTFYILFN